MEEEGFLLRKKGEISISNFSVDALLHQEHIVKCNMLQYL